MSSFVSKKKTFFTSIVSRPWNIVFYNYKYNATNTTIRKTTVKYQLTSPAWNGRSINPASFSAPPGLKFQAPLDGPCHGTLPIVPFLTNSQRRIRLKKKQVIHNQTRWIPAHTPTVAPKPRSHPSYYQGFNSKEFKQNGLHNRDTSRYRGRFIICSLNPNTAATETY